MKKKGGDGGKKGKSKSGGFESLKLGDKVYGGIKRKGYKVPTPIQRKTLPLILSGYDVVAMARTGSGKTAAFLIPMLERLKQHVPQGGVRALILSPTRDLALQTLKFTKELGKFTDIRISLLVGGDNMESQFEELAQNPDVIIGTPGRLMHHLSEVEDMSLRTVEYVVFDEADSLFSMGFAEQMKQILSQLRENRQTLLFSATLPSGLAEFAKAGLRDPQVVRLDLETKISPDLNLVFFTLHQEEKNAALLYLVRDHVGSDQQTLIFVSTKHHAEFLAVLFREEGIEPSVCYGDMDQDARKFNVARFRARKTMLLIVTDVAARGIDIPLLDNVVNWDFPPTPKIFVHRVGRVARAGRQGTSFSFVTPNDMAYLLDLHLFLSKNITAAPIEGEVLEGEKGNAAAGNGETVYGRFQQDIIDLISDHVRETIDSSTELTSLQKTCANAFTLYSSNRPKPSSESIRRVKDLPREGLHPLFRNMVGANELTTLAFTERLRNFRPKITILEAEGAAAKSKNVQGSSSQWVDIMRKKRAVHDETIDIVHNQYLIKETETEKCILQEKKVVGFMKFGGCFKDEEYFIDAVPKSHHLESGLSATSNEKYGSTRIEAAVLDLVADDSQGIHKQKSAFHWDRRSKKYVRLNNGDRVTSSGKVKTESGLKGRVGRTGIYKKWKERCHTHIGSSREDADADTTFTGGVRKGKRRRGDSKIANSHLGSEIKSMEQIRKQRQTQYNRISHLKNKSSSTKSPKSRSSKKNKSRRKPK